MGCCFFRELPGGTLRFYRSPRKPHPPADRGNPNSSILGLVRSGWGKIERMSAISTKTHYAVAAPAVVASVANDPECFVVYAARR